MRFLFIYISQKNNNRETERERDLSETIRKHPIHQLPRAKIMLKSLIIIGLPINLVSLEILCTRIN